MAVEPNIKELPAKLAEFENVQLTELNDAIRDADIVLLLVDHDEIKAVDPSTVNAGFVYDTRGAWRTK